MSMRAHAKREYLESIRLRYHNGNRTVKAQILQEFCAICGYHRKSAIRLLHQKINDLAFRWNKPRKKRGRRGIHQGDAEFLSALRLLWKETEYMCSKNLHSAMPEWLPYVERHYATFEQPIREKLLRVSVDG